MTTLRTRYVWNASPRSSGMRNLINKRIGNVMGEKIDVAAGTLEPNGFEGEYGRKCSKCGRTAYFVDKCFKKMPVEFMCIDCAMKEGDVEFVAHEETAKFWGLDKDVADDLAKRIVKKKRIEDGIGIAS